MGKEEEKYTWRKMRMKEKCCQIETSADAFCDFEEGSGLDTYRLKKELNADLRSENYESLL